MDEQSEKTRVEIGKSCLESLLPGLQRLDRLLEQAVSAAHGVYGPEAASDPYRGLYTDRQQAERWLQRPPGTPWCSLLDAGIEEPLVGSLAEDSKLAQLTRQFELSGFDLDLVLVGLAPELDLRYGQLYAYLQDDVMCRRPSVDLALNLLCVSAVEKLARRDRIAPQSPLIRHGLMQLIPDPRTLQPPLLSYWLKLDDGVVRWLLGQRGLDPRLTSFCQRIDPTSQQEILSPETTISGESIAPMLCRFIEKARTAQQSLTLHFSGTQDAQKRQAAIAVTQTVGAPLLIADLSATLNEQDLFPLRLNWLFREAGLHRAILYLEGLDRLRDREPAQFFYRCLLRKLAEEHAIAILAGTQPWIPTEMALKGVLDVPFPLPDFAQRKRYWQVNLADAGMMVKDAELDMLANRFRLSSDQIADAIATARHQCRMQTAAASNDLELSIPPTPTANDLCAAARTQSGQALQTLARKIIPQYDWPDIVLPADPFSQLQEICNQAKYRHIVYEQWGFDRKLSLGKGLNVLFSGPPGTGKTMAAEVIASDLQLEIYKIDLSQVVSKYIGDTEKNLDRIFAAAVTANAILLFDEADALFGKRSEVRDARDRYANLEIGYLLQKMEEYEGIAILSTNLRQNLDEAFVRRLHFIVEFPFPDETDRRRIWQVIFPPETPLCNDVDFDLLATRVRLAGGNIKNIALTAAFYAAQSGNAIQLPHLEQAIRREYQKLGRSWSEPLVNENCKT